MGARKWGKEGNRRIATELGNAVAHLADWVLCSIDSQYNMAMGFIELQHISHRYGGFAALKDVCLDLEPGRIGLLGPNGAGKSTLLKILMGLLSPSEGSGSLFGTD